MGKKHGQRPPKALKHSVYRVESGGWSLTDAAWCELVKNCQPKLNALVLAARTEGARALAASPEVADRATLETTVKRSKAAYWTAFTRATNGERNDTSPLTGNIESDAAAGRDFIAKATQLVNDFIVEARRERTTPRADSVAEWLDRLGKAAAALHAAYNAPLAPAAKSMVRADIERMMREATIRIDRKMPRDLAADHPRTSPAVRLADLASACQRVAWAAEEAASDLEVEPELDGGAAWRRFVVRLRDLCGAFGLRTGISSAGDDAVFVIFFAAVMTKLPLEVARNSTPEALAKALQRAVAEQRKIENGTGAKEI